MRTRSPLSFQAIAGVFFSSAILLSSSTLPAQNSAVAPRITANVDESLLTTLKGNVPQRARAEYDQGEAPGSTQMTHVRLVLQRSSQQQAALDAYLAELQDKSSPNYHEWLMPAEFGKLYGPADSDVAALVAWLESHGLKLEAVSQGRTNIAFSGMVSQVEEAFHTTIHSFTVNGSQFFSNTTDPQIPQALAAVVKGVANLNTIRPKPQFVRGSEGKFNPQSKRLEPAAGANPSLTSGGNNLYIVPGDAATIYDTPNSYNANFSGGTSYNGAGVYIGIGGDAAINASIVESYRVMFIGDSTQPTLNYCTNASASSCTNSPGSGYDANDADEAYIDTELAGGMAPGAIIIYYASPDLTTAIDAAITQNQVDIFSLSFGDCESDMGTSGNAQINSFWEQAAAQGIAVTVSSGDDGSAGCDNDNTQTTAKGGLQVSGFASTPYNIAVGGTDFYPLTNSFSTYVSTSQGSSSTYYRTALKYIPESTWNDSSKTDDFISTNVPVTGTSDGMNLANIVAGSGGVSSVYSKPSWQTGTGVPADGKRDLPDVSLMSGNGYDAATWAICDDDTTTYNGQTVTMDCETQPDGYWFTDGFGGTSTAAPSFAGILALVEQKTGGRLGQATSALYALYNSAPASTIFHDITVGNNSVPCDEGSQDCTDDSMGYYFESGYNTTADYDLATGMGSVDATQLVDNWSSGTGWLTPTVTVAPTPNPINSSQSLSVKVTVTGSSNQEASPSGTVTLSAAATNSSTAIYSASAEVLSGGTYTFAVPANTFASGGSYTITAIYSGDMDYSQGVGADTVTVSVPTFTLAATSPASSIGPGGSASSTVTATAVDGYAGSVTLSCAMTQGPTNTTGDAPTCSFLNGSTITLSGTTTSGSVTATVNTTAATSELIYPKLPGGGWAGAGSGAILALLVFLGIPSRRRSWRQMLGIVVLMTAIGSLASCGGVSVGGGGGGGNLQPTISSLSPNSATAGGSGFTLTVNGTNFTSGATAYWGSTSLTTTYVSSTQLTATVPANLIATAGTASVTVVAAGGTSSGATFTVGNPSNPGTTAGTYTFTVTGTGNPSITPAPTITFTVTVN
ncbi:MAG: protease pro-enzyme activation domain-containing protein [Terracidiphilus sp.]|jgi:subtilase family serine protease